ncbi:MAG: putative Fe-S cluster assembly protein SufT [Planctomycetes bacterium]|nr:putative Fe-S cluster assembly protein SufT [Planctomycetota bacterium]
MSAPDPSPKGPVDLKRDCPAVQIPSGAPLILPAGTRVTITQALGGTFTVVTGFGQMVRIDGRDADAMGLPSSAKSNGAVPAQAPKSEEELRARIAAELKTVYDPEVPVNVVDLGLIFDTKVTSAGPERWRVEVKMGLTAPGCGMGDVLRADARKRIEALPGVEEAEVQIVLDPPWDKSMMSDAARLQLGMF